MEDDNFEKLRQLVEFLKANEIAEFEIDRPDLKLRLKFTGAELARAQQLFTNGGGIANLAAPIAAPPAPAAAPVAAEPEEKLHEVKSPIVGTFYESPSPGSPAFVKVGDQVELGQVLCIVEAMKLMNEIECDMAGEVVKRIATPGQPVEYGQPLFSIRAK